MFKLTIGEMNCAVSDFEHDTFCFYTFDARKDIFNLNDGDNGLVRFVQSVNPSDTTIQDSINIVQTICAEGRHTTDIETSLGMYGVSFPAISTDGALLCYCENLICIVLSVIRYLSIMRQRSDTKDLVRTDSATGEREVRHGASTDARKGEAGQANCFGGAFLLECTPEGRPRQHKISKGAHFCTGQCGLSLR